METILAEIVDLILVCIQIIIDILETMQEEIITE